MIDVGVDSSPLFKFIAAMNLQTASSPLFKSIDAMNRQMASSPLFKSIDAMNRQMASSPLFKSIDAMNLQTASSPLFKSIDAMNRQMASSPLFKSIDAMNLQMASSPLFKSICAMNQQMAGSHLVKSVAALGQLATSPPTHGFKESLTYRDAILTREAVTTREGLELGVGSDVMGIEVPLLTGERQCLLMQFDACVKDDGLREACRSLFANGHYALAVQKACIYVDNMVRAKSGRADKYGADLMRAVFSPDNPVLRLNELETRSNISEQRGYMDIFAGTMTGIRNPQAHEYDLEDSPEEALERLGLANHLMRMLKRSTLA